MNRIDRATKKALRDRECKERANGRRSTAPELAARYDALFETLTRAHCVPYERMDWHEIAGAGMVEPAVRANALEQKARRALANYQPGIIDGLFGLGQDRRRALAERVLEAAKKDAENYARAKRAADVHNLDVGLAAAVLALDIGAIEQALKAHIPAAEFTPILEGLGVHMPAPGKLVVYVDCLEYDAIPDEAVEIGDTGRAVFVALPPEVRQEMHLANVCATTLRVAVEVLAVVPLDMIDVVARCFLVKGRGEAEQSPVVHVKVTHQALKAMDLRRLEPVSSITALGGRIDWEVERGFAEIRIDDLKLTAPKPPEASQTAAA
ncbi:hypothetical protein [Phenylobacterium sp.]|uniref:hypothetical protein n=1 Tax=Phenylobacterium sp. TaxID=1871053 RepID=UPI0027366483|nr:hypothetical protein [Phenylobacterium sp.]MDP3854753.1 hypothetical protein [Phenylobacterium sp.]